MHISQKFMYEGDSIPLLFGLILKSNLLSIPHIFYQSNFCIICLTFHYPCIICVNGKNHYFPLISDCLSRYSGIPFSIKVLQQS